MQSRTNWEILFMTDGSNIWWKSSAYPKNIFLPPFPAEIYTGIYFNDSCFFVNWSNCWWTFQTIKKFNYIFSQEEIPI